MRTTAFLLSGLLMLGTIVAMGDSASAAVSYVRGKDYKCDAKEIGGDYKVAVTWERSGSKTTVVEPYTVHWSGSRLSSARSNNVWVKYYSDKSDNGSTNTNFSYNYKGSYTYPDKIFTSTRESASYNPRIEIKLRVKKSDGTIKRVICGKTIFYRADMGLK